MAMPDAREWSERIRTDLEWRKTKIDPRMNRCLLLLNPSVEIRDEQLRIMAPIARRVARGLTTMDFLHRLPHIDAEYKGPNADHGEDDSNFIEDHITLIANSGNVRNRLKQMQSTLLWSPIAFVKCGVHLVGVERDDGKSPATPEMIEGVDAFREEYEEVPPDLVASLGLADQEIPELDGAQREEVKLDPLPTPATSLDIPWCDWVDPRHMIFDRGVNEFKDSYYVGHLFTRTHSQFKNGPYINKELVMKYATASTEGKDKKHSPLSYLGGTLMKSFNIPSADEVVVLCEVYIREDPNNSQTKQLMGVLDLISGVWVKEPRPHPLGVYPYESVKATDDAPGAWSGPSYIEQAWDDIAELAWSRIEFKKHVQFHRSHKDLIPDGVEFSPEEWAKYEDPDYTGPVRFGGSPGAIAAIARGPNPPSMPPALIQWNSLSETSFARNTGITGTQQGQGASNKVATAFRQEERFSDERRAEIRYRLYSAYARIMTIMTFLIQRYMTNPVEIRSGRVKFLFSGDTLSGIINYTVDVIDLERSDPMSDRLVEIQTIERLLGHPVLAQHFDHKELAKIVAKANRWGARVLARGQQPPQGQPEGPETPGNTGGSRTLGSGVDSAGLNGDTASAVEGAALR